MKKPKIFNLRFNSGPNPEGTRFIKAETLMGESFKVGIWHENDDGTWFLTIDCSDIYEQGWNDGARSQADFPNRG